MHYSLVRYTLKHLFTCNLVLVKGDGYIYTYVPKSKKVALIGWRLVLGVWPIITHGTFCGEAIAWWRCVCDVRCGSQYAFAILPRSKLARYLVCVERRAISRKGCVLSWYFHVD